MLLKYNLNFKSYDCALADHPSPKLNSSPVIFQLQIYKIGFTLEISQYIFPNGFDKKASLSITTTNSRLLSYCRISIFLDPIFVVMGWIVKIQFFSVYKNKETVTSVNSW